MNRNFKHCEVNIHPIGDIMGMRQKITGMLKILFRLFCYLSAVAMLGVVGVILYLVMAESGYPVFYLVCAYAAVYALTFVIGYGLMRNLNILLRLGRFAVYIVAAVEGNIIIILLLPRLYLVSCLLFTLVVFILLAFLNFTISKVIFAASNREACLIGMLTGFVGALLSMMVGPAFFI